MGTQKTNFDFFFIFWESAIELAQNSNPTFGKAFLDDVETENYWEKERRRQNEREKRERDRKEG